MIGESPEVKKSGWKSPRTLDRSLSLQRFSSFYSGDSKSRNCEKAEQQFLVGGIPKVEVSTVQNKVGPLITARKLFGVSSSSVSTVPTQTPKDITLERKKNYECDTSKDESDSESTRLENKSANDTPDSSSLSLELSLTSCVTEESDASMNATTKNHISCQPGQSGVQYQEAKVKSSSTDAVCRSENNTLSVESANASGVGCDSDKGDFSKSGPSTHIPDFEDDIFQSDDDEWSVSIPDLSDEDEEEVKQPGSSADCSFVFPLPKPCINTLKTAFIDLSKNNVLAIGAKGAGVAELKTDLCTIESDVRFENPKSNPPIPIENFVCKEQVDDCSANKTILDNVNASATATSSEDLNLKCKKTLIFDNVAANPGVSSPKADCPVETVSLHTPRPKRGQDDMRNWKRVKPLSRSSSKKTKRERSISPEENVTWTVMKKSSKKSSPKRQKKVSPLLLLRYTRGLKKEIGIEADDLRQLCIASPERKKGEMLANTPDCKCKKRVSVRITPISSENI